MARVLYWFRTDLRITDSPALTKALGIADIESFTPVWCWDPNYIYGHKVGLNRWSFLLESMTNLSEQLTKLDKKQKMRVIRGPPEMVMPLMWKSWGITHLVYEKDSNAYAKVRDERIKGLAKEAGVEVVEVHGRHLYDPEEVVKANKGKPTMTLNQWQHVSCPCSHSASLDRESPADRQKATSTLKGLEEVSPTPDSLPDPAEKKLDYDKKKYDNYKWPDHDVNEHIRTGKDTCYRTYFTCIVLLV